jgi:hypothetical protein
VTAKSEYSEARPESQEPGGKTLGLPNAFFDVMGEIDTKSEFKVTLFVAIEQTTYNGWVCISLSEFGQYTSLSNSAVIDGVRRALVRGYVQRYRQGMKSFYSFAARSLQRPSRPIADICPDTRTRIPDDTRWMVWERDNFTCLHCGMRSRLSIDHITPVSKGGSDEPSNLQTLCHPCNSRKGAK